MASGKTGPDESAGLQQTLQQFDSLIARSARRASRYITGSEVMAEDLAQDVRFHLSRALGAGRVEANAVRTVITNSLRDRIRFERSRIQLASSKISEPDDRDTVFSQTDSCSRPEILTVAKWVASLPGCLRAVFDLLYGSGYTQREASTMLGLSQPRVTQLHQELLQRGRADLAALAA